MEIVEGIEVVSFMSLRYTRWGGFDRAIGPEIKLVSFGHEALDVGSASGVGWGKLVRCINA